MDDNALLHHCTYTVDGNAFDVSCELVGPDKTHMKIRLGNQTWELALLYPDDLRDEMMEILRLFGSKKAIELRMTRARELRELDPQLRAVITRDVNSARQEKAPDD